MPGVRAGGRRVEDAYDTLRAAVRTETGLEPRARRIFSVGCRLAGRDRHIEVGRPHPLSGEPVLAIFDVGGAQPYAVCTASGETLRLDKHVYWVTEFA